MALVSFLLLAIGISVSSAFPSEQNGTSVTNPRCSKTMKRMYRPSGDGLTYLGDYSWMVAFGYQNKDNPDLVYKCGGMLISDKWVLTAAQCVTGLGNSELVKLRIGDLTLSSEIDDGRDPDGGKNIDEIKVHPDYKIDSVGNDIALVRLKEPSKKRGIHPICLLSGAEFLKDDWWEGKFGFALGWGVSKVGGGLSSKLLEGTLNFVKSSACQEKYNELATRKDKLDAKDAKYGSVTINEKLFCAGDSDQSACEGDTGGPLVFIDEKDNRHYLGGIISGIYKCGIGYPNLFTRVAAYTQWINDVTGENFA